MLLLSQHFEKPARAINWRKFTLTTQSPTFIQSNCRHLPSLLPFPRLSSSFFPLPPPPLDDQLGDVAAAAERPLQAMKVFCLNRERKKLLFLTFLWCFRPLRYLLCPPPSVETHRSCTGSEFLFILVYPSDINVNLLLDLRIEPE